MRKYMQEFIQKIEKDLENKKDYSGKELSDLLEKIKFFQHERLIHLLVTFFFALLTLIFMVLGMVSYLFLIPFAILIVFLIFYVIHYFYLENSVQYLYKLYDELKVKMPKTIVKKKKEK